MSVSGSTRATCAYCLGPLPAPPARGRPRRYCSAACRRDAHRSREAFTFGDPPPAPSTPIPAGDARRLETVQALLAVVDDAQPADPETRLARAVLETQTIGWAYRRLSREVGRDLGWRAVGVADALDDALRRYFPTIVEPGPAASAGVPSGATESGGPG